MKSLRSLKIASLALLLATGNWQLATAQEKLPPGAKLARIDAHPATINLKHPFAYSQLLLTGTLEGGEQLDVTRLAKAEAPANLVSLSPTGLVRPLADGNGQLKFTLEGKSAAVPVTVTGQKDKYHPSFVGDIMPAMSKLGCNAGTCHGAQAGKNGFKLSLRGYNPLYDHQALTDDVFGRRFNPAAPERSLMLLKPAGEVPHTGGAFIRPGEPSYELLRRWIGDGVKLDLESPRVSSIEVLPRSAVIPLLGMKQQMKVHARYSNGSERDVSTEAFIESSNTEVATVDKAGLVTAVRRGEATMLARYEGAYAAGTLISMGDRGGFAWQPVHENNYIDALVYDKLKRVKVLPSGLCTDAEFVRRLYLDLTGLPPTPEQVRAFVADGRPTKVKRDELIDKLIGSPEYVEHWTNKWADLLQVNRKFLGEKGAAALRAWIRQAVAGNMPYEKFCHEVLTASGSTLQSPPAAYYKVLRQPDAAMENSTQLFLAVRFNCNKCHDHPFERWTQDQYYQLAAFFAQVGRKEDPSFKGQRVGGTDVEAAVPLVEIVSDIGSGDVKHERTGAVTAPKFPYTHKGLPPANLSRRQQLAGWITAKENPYFAKSYVNRLWSYLLGVGLIEPIDDIRAGNPPTNPQLLDRLTDEFIKGGFNVQELVRVICKSRTYQHTLETNKWNADDEINYSHALARRLPAEVLYDAIHRATGSTANLPGLPPGARAAQLLDSNVQVPSGFLDLFGKPPRESACECERSGSMMLGPILNLVNGPIVADAIKDPNNRIAKLVAGHKDDAKVIEELFVAILCRPPTKAEVANALQAFRSSEAEQARLQAELKRRTADRDTYEKQLPAKQLAWEKTIRPPTWHVVETLGTETKGNVVLTKQPDGSLLASGPSPITSVYTVKTKTPVKGITGIRLETLSDPSLPGKGPGRGKGNFVLTEFSVKAAPQGESAKAKPVALQNPKASFAQDGLGIDYVLDGDQSIGWAISPRMGQAHTAFFEVKEPIRFDKGAELTFQLDQLFKAAPMHTLGKFRLAVTADKPPFMLDGTPENIIQLALTDPAKRTDAQKKELADYYRGIDVEWKRVNEELVAFGPVPDKRLLAAQDVAWALLNTPAFLFNR